MSRLELDSCVNIETDEIILITQDRVYMRDGLAFSRFWVESITVDQPMIEIKNQRTPCTGRSNSSCWLSPSDVCFIREDWSGVTFFLNTGLKLSADVNYDETVKHFPALVGVTLLSDNSRLHVRKDLPFTREDTGVMLYTKMVTDTCGRLHIRGNYENS